MSWRVAEKFKYSRIASKLTPSTSKPTIGNVDSEMAGVSKYNQSINPKSDSNTAPEPTTGILVVKLHEAKDLSIPNELQEPSIGESPSPWKHDLRGNDRLQGSEQRETFTGRTMKATADDSIISSTHASRDLDIAGDLPYALLEFDKVQVVVNSVAGTLENPRWAGDSVDWKLDVSRMANLTIHFHLRNQYAFRKAGQSGSILLGSINIQPRFEEFRDDKSDLVEKSRDSQAEGHGISRWFDIINGTGKVRLSVEFIGGTQKSLTIEDFELMKVIGKGSYGKVMQVKKKDTQRIYALKTIRKAHVIFHSEVVHTLAERSVQAQVNNPFIVPLKFAFQSPEKLYLVQPFINGGELFYHLQREQRFDVNRSRLYTSELACALECLHSSDIIYRDLKPENVLLDYSGHIVLCDFGLCKLEMKKEDRTTTFCGTPEYLPPELLLGQGYTMTADWWSLGILLYEMLIGLPPFYDKNVDKMYRNIISEPVLFPEGGLAPPVAKSLIARLLDRDPELRLGAKGSSEVKDHPFFDGIDWQRLLRRGYNPSFRPNVGDALDTSNFDKEFTGQTPVDSHVTHPALSSKAQKEFAGWSYTRPSGCIESGST